MRTGPLAVLVCLSFGLSLAATAEPGPAGAPDPAREQAKPLILFVGDSITAGHPSGQPDYRPSDQPAPAHFAAGHYGYVEAIWEATHRKDVPFRIDKLGNGGQSIVGWIGVTCKQVIEKRHAEVKEMPAHLVIQDYITGKTPDALKAIESAVRILNDLAVKEGHVKLVLCTVVTDPKGASGLKAPDADVAATNDLFIRTAKELNIPIIRLDTAWSRYVEFSKDKAPAKDWILTSHGSYADGVHPGKVGAFFQALVFARELGVPPEKFDETAPALGVPAAQAAEIKKLVYSWKEPTVIPPPEAKSPVPPPPAPAPAPTGKEKKPEPPAKPKPPGAEDEF